MKSSFFLNLILNCSSYSFVVIHTYILKYIYTLVHIYIQTNINTRINKYIHTYIRIRTHKLNYTAEEYGLKKLFVSCNPTLTSFYSKKSLP